MTILSKKKTSGTKDRREGGNGSEVDVHGVQSEHGSGSIALPNSPYQVRKQFIDFLISTCLPYTPDTV